MTKHKHSPTSNDAHTPQVVPDDLKLWPAMRARILGRPEPAPVVSHRSARHAALTRLRWAVLLLGGVIAIVVPVWGLRPRAC